MNYTILTLADKINILLEVEADAEDGAMRLNAEFFTFLGISPNVLHIQEGLLSSQEIAKIPNIGYYIDLLTFQDSLDRIRQIQLDLGSVNSIWKSADMADPPNSATSDVLGPFILSAEDKVCLRKWGIGE